MAIIKYSLDNGRIPSYISDGGYFLATDGTRIGIGSGGGTELTKSQLLSHVLAVHAANPYDDPATRGKYTRIGNNKTNAEVTADVNAWCTARGIS